MADAVILTQETYDRIMKVVKKWEEGELPLIMGRGLGVEEVGPSGMKIGLQKGGIIGDGTITLNVCIDSTPTPTTFITKLVSS